MDGKSGRRDALAGLVSELAALRRSEFNLSREILRAAKNPPRGDVFELKRQRAIIRRMGDRLEESLPGDTAAG